MTGPVPSGMRRTPLPPQFASFFPNRPSTGLLSSYFSFDFQCHSFDDIVVAAVDRFDSSAKRQRALQAAASSPSIDFSQVAKDSDAFVQAPLSALRSFSNKFANTRLNRQFLSSPSWDTYPEIDLLRSISEEVNPILSSSFQPSANNAAVRPQMTAILPAIYSLFQANYANGEVFLISRRAFLDSTKFHSLPASLSNISWHTEKFMNDLGRLLYDYSNVESGTPINSDFSKDAYKSHYGQLHYPTVSDYISMFWNAQMTFPGSPIYVVKSDVHRAYHRFKWSPQGSVLLALLVSEDLVALPVTGGFGSTGSPFIYDPIGRFLQWNHDTRRHGAGFPHKLGGTYVDDIVFFASLSYALREIKAHENLVNMLLGPAAAHRRELSQILDVIGTRFDCSKSTVSISKKGYLKLVYLFFHIIPPHIQLSKTYPIALFQCLAGLVSRYGFFIPLLRHTPSVFYRLLKGPFSSNRRRFTHLSVHYVDLWRDYLVYAFDNPSILSTTMVDYFHNSTSSFDPKSLVAVYSSYSDATLHTLGVFVPNLGWCKIEVASFTTLQISIANLEFIALFLSFLLAHKLSPASTHIHLYVDNQNAEAWSRGRISNDSNLSLSLTAVNSILQSTLNVVQTRAYIKSEANISADSISRRCFNNSDQLPHYSPTNQTLTFLSSLVKEPDPRPYHLLQEIHTILASGVFSRT